ncbi:MAG: Ni/Fe hydrogenase subunit alpha [Candidatus Diapherotrites archaeon]|nr:Ni/Fe hydrogenase subunit alpha [Candidatus Diapherotrites archaeon]
MQQAGWISIKEITKIEGHASLDLELKEGKVEQCRLNIFEGQRFFEQMVVGRHYTQIPLIVGRICGLCNVSHLSTAIEAVENAFNAKVTEQTKVLRELATHGEFIKSHALHLVFLALPDFLGRESALAFNKEEMRFVQAGLEIKKAGTDIVRLLGGRVYQTASIRAGGFTALPKQKQLEALLPQLQKVRKDAIGLIHLFDGFGKKMPFERKTFYAAIAGKGYSFLEGPVRCTDGTLVPEQEAIKHIQEYAVQGSAAKQALFNKRPFKVGSQARINLNQQELHKEARKISRELATSLPSDKAHVNNLAQAIELLHCIDSAIEILNSLKVRKEQMAEIKTKEAIGVGVTEAPRGTLYHQYSFGADGYVKAANLIIPTQQNTRNIEEDLKVLVPQLLPLPQEKAEIEIEKLVRSYDPCISCATHFLRVNWSKK